MKMITMMGTFVLSISIMGCKESVTSPPLDELSAFPLSVGSRWTYAVYDSVSLKGDTVEVTIDQKTLTSPAKDIYLWRYRYGAHTDTVYVVRSVDTVSFLYGLTGYGHEIDFVFPLNVGKRWRIPFSDSVRVLSQETIDVPSGSYPETFRIEAMSLIPNDYSRFSYWVKPNVGIVKIFRGVFVTVDPQSTRKETWQLLSYSLAR